MSLIIPKREIENLDIIKNKFDEIGLKIIDELDWEWK